MADDITFSVQSQCLLCKLRSSQAVFLISLNLAPLQYDKKAAGKVFPLPPETLPVFLKD